MFKYDLNGNNMYFTTLLDFWKSQNLFGSLGQCNLFWLRTSLSKKQNQDIFTMVLSIWKMIKVLFVRSAQSSPEILFCVTKPYSLSQQSIVFPVVQD